MHPELSTGLADTHCHLNFDIYNHDRDDVIQRARQAGIKKILIPAVDIETSKSAIDLAAKYPEIYVAIGIHPNSGNRWKEDTFSELKELAKHQKVVAIGEIGLDYYRNITDRDIQRKIFMKQLELAADINLPVIIHNRNASDDILPILKEWHQTLCKSVIKLGDNPGVMHSFSSELKLAISFIEMNFKIGITGPVTFQKSHELQAIVEVIALDYLLIETDAPFLTPHPFRGKRNEPANVKIVAEKIADLKGTTLDIVAQTTSVGASRLFRWREIL